jgi:hypothetical protein
MRRPILNSDGGTIQQSDLVNGGLFAWHASWYADRRAALTIPSWLGPDESGGAGRDTVSNGLFNTTVAVGRVCCRLLSARCCRAAGLTVPIGVAALVLALVASLGVATPALGASAPRLTLRDDAKDATDGGYVAPPRRIVFPSLELGLSQQRPIPLGATCSCTIDRVGLVSQFDITVLTVEPDAVAIVQQLNRFNRPARPGARYVAAYVGQQYIAGPRDQAYTTSEADWKATTTDERLSDVSQLFHTEVEYRPRADVYPGNYVNGWLIFELPLNRPAYLVWNYNFVGERGIWFALQ